MKDIKRPEFMRAAMEKRGHNAVPELLIALLVFFVGDIVVGILQMPAMLVYFLTDKEYLAMILNYSVDLQKVTDLVMNMPDGFMIANLLFEVGLIVTVILYCRLFEKRKAWTMGFRRKGLGVEYLKGMIIGSVMFVAAYGICVITGSADFSSVSSEGTTGLYIFGFFAGYLVQGMAEEVLCRGYLLVSLSRRYSVFSSVILSAAFFSMLHSMNAGVGLLAYINLFAFGTFMGLLFVRCENIWIVGAVHSVWNFLQGNIFGVQVSGMKLQPSLFTTELLGGKEIINGGSFGMEGGLAVTIILAAATAVLLLDLSKRGYFVEAEPAAASYVQASFGGEQVQNQSLNPYQTSNQNPNSVQNPYQTSGQNPNSVQNPYQTSGQNPNSVQNPYQTSDRNSNPVQNPYQKPDQNPNPVQNPYQASNQNPNPVQSSYQTFDQSLNSSQNMGQFPYPFPNNHQAGQGYQNSMPGQAKKQQVYENMGVNPSETPWHPKEENPEEKKMTGFDQNYFKD